jgi:hypothetical protein
VILASLDSSSSSYGEERSRPEPPDGRPVRSMDRRSLVIVRPATEGKSALARWDESFERASAGQFLRAAAKIGGRGRKRIRTAEGGMKDGCRARRPNPRTLNNDCLGRRFEIRATPAHRAPHSQYDHRILKHDVVHVMPR